MEVAWEDRGKISHDAYFQGAFSKWEIITNITKNLWCCVYDVCVSAQKLTTTDGEIILVTEDDN